jgi:predicted aminopeptidase
VGSVPYKGFFNAADARSEVEKLNRKDLDVLIRHVDAFSTLGWFQDPLYSYMQNYSVQRLADLIIHETLHATVYIKGQSQFNEELAEFVGTEGSRLYIEKRFGKNSPEYRQMIESEAGSTVYVGFIQSLIAELEVVYASDMSKEDKLAQKDVVIKSAQKRFSENYDVLFKTDVYRFFSTLVVNNAYLELFRLYYADDSYLQDIFERSGSDLPAFIVAARTIKGNKDPKEQLIRALIGE